MRQVPKENGHNSFLIIGSGRLARHLKHYLELKGISALIWSRTQNGLEDLKLKIQRSSWIALAISDSAIEDFYKTHIREYTSKKCIHFSGALYIPNVYGCHPLCSFTHDLYELSFYEKIPLVLDSNSSEILNLFTNFKNPKQYLDPQKKSLYHALCVMGGNFSVILWEYLFEKFKIDLNLDPKFLGPYLIRTFQNLENELIESTGSVLTGPLVRGDFKVIQKHLEVLKSDPYSEIYRAFVNVYMANNFTQTDQLKKEAQL